MPFRRHRMTSASYRDAVLATNPVGYWRLGEASGTVARGEVSADGTYVASPILGVRGLLIGDPATAMRTTGTESMTASAGGGSAVWSCGAWLRPASLSQLGFAYTCGGAVQFGVGSGSGGPGSKLQIGLLSIAWMDGGYTYPDTTSSHFIVLTRDGTTIRVYVDAIERATSVTVPFVPNGSNVFGVAANGNYSGDTQDAFRSWSVLPPDVIADLYRIGMGR